MQGFSVYGWLGFCFGGRLHDPDARVCFCCVASFCASQGGCGPRACVTADGQNPALP